MDFVCGKCNTKLEKSPALLSNGCTKCGSKVFKTITSSSELLRNLRSLPQVRIQTVEESGEKSYEIVPKIIFEDIEQKRIDDLKDDSIPSVKLKEKGVYEVNIDGLFRNKQSDPIILSGKTGIYRVEFMPQNKKEK
ncbi:MAG: hypothetical protein JXA54_04600 [Candidatus Heimdallarchaeota archaeon]|nr:hypothetical protein [Candidatus Heimdallarchaeota archaeon]